MTIPGTDQPGDPLESAAASTGELLARAQSGDEDALGRLLERYRPRLMRWARGRLPPAARARLETEDLVQETLLAVVRRGSEIEVAWDGALQAYVRRAIVNRVRDEIRRASRRPAETAPVELSAGDGSSPLEQAIGHEALAAYEAGLDTLSEAEREAVVGRVEMGFSYAELAELLGKPSADAARMTVARALVKLAGAMGVARA